MVGLLRALPWAAWQCAVFQPGGDPAAWHQGLSWGCSGDHSPVWGVQPWAGVTTVTCNHGRLSEVAETWVRPPAFTVWVIRCDELVHVHPSLQCLWAIASGSILIWLILQMIKIHFCAISCPCGWLSGFTVLGCLSLCWVGSLLEEPKFRIWPQWDPLYHPFSCNTAVVECLAFYA